MTVLNHGIGLKPEIEVLAITAEMRKEWVPWDL